MAGKGTSYRALEWAWTRNTSPACKLVLVNLAGRVDQAYSCFPAVRLIAEETGLNRATVFRVLAELEEADLILIANRRRPNGSRRSSRYYLNHDQAPHVTGELTDDDEIDRETELADAAKRSIERTQLARTRSHRATTPPSHDATPPQSHTATPGSRVMRPLGVAQ